MESDVNQIRQFKCTNNNATLSSAAAKYFVDHSPNYMRGRIQQFGRIGVQSLEIKDDNYYYWYSVDNGGIVRIHTYRTSGLAGGG